MSTPYQKRLAAGSLRWYADQIEPALDSIPGLSYTAWDCPAGDTFEAEAIREQGDLASAAGTLRSVASSLEYAADAQEQAEAEAAAAAAAAAAEAEAASDASSDTGASPPANVF